MADEIIKRDQNRVTVSGAVTDDANTEVKQLRVDPTTLRLKVQSLSLTDLVGAAYNYVGVTWNAGTFTEVFTFKTGGSGGTTVATITVVYTDATKEQLASVTKA